MGEYRNPDLQRILAGLTGAIQSTAAPTSSVPNNVAIPGLGLLPPPSEIPPKSARLESPAKSRPATPVPDSSTITTWPAALKFITKHIVTNEAAATRIKHLIAQQAKHEREWWNGREVLIERQSGRAGRQSEAAALLKSIGGFAAPVIASTDPVANKNELEAYDLKVYAGLMKMSADFDRQLRGLGVPFFSIKYGLVAVDGKVGEGNGGVVDKGELRELQKKVLQTLEDLLID